MSATLQNFSYYTQSAVFSFIDDGLNSCVIFTPTVPYWASVAEVRGVKWDAASTGTVTAHIYAAYEGTPTTVLGSSNPVSFAEITDNRSDPGLVTFTFDAAIQVNADVSYALVLTGTAAGVHKFMWWSAYTGGELRVGFQEVGAGWSMSDNGARWFEIWGVSGVDLTYPENGLTDVYLNENWLQNFLWKDDDDPYPLSAYTVWFWRPSTGWVEQTDRSRYSIITYKLNLKGTHEYVTTYYWFVRKDLGDEAYVDSAIWSFTTMSFAPPTYSTSTRIVDADGGVRTFITGESNQITIRRLVVAAKNKIFYSLAPVPPPIIWLTMDRIDADGNPVDQGSKGMLWIARGSAVQGDGIIDKGFDFVLETGDYLDVVVPANLPMGASNRTTALWVRTTAAIVQTLLNFGTAAAGQRWTMQITAGGQLFLGVGGGSKTGTGIINDGEWHHVAMTYNADDGADVSDVIFYVDGEPDAQSATAARDINTVNLQLEIGGFNATPYFTGSCDDVRIYDRELSAAEISDLYELGAA